MIENVSTQLTVFHCLCPLPASRKGLRLHLRSALFGEGGRDWRPCNCDLQNNIWFASAKQASGQGIHCLFKKYIFRQKYTIFIFNYNLTPLEHVKLTNQKLMFQIRRKNPLVNNDVARTRKKLRTSKGDYPIKQRFSSLVSLFKMGTPLKGKNLLPGGANSFL